MSVTHLVYFVKYQRYSLKSIPITYYHYFHYSSNEWVIGSITYDFIHENFMWFKNDSRVTLPYTSNGVFVVLTIRAAFKSIQSVYRTKQVYCPLQMRALHIRALTCAQPPTMLARRAIQRISQWMVNKQTLVQNTKLCKQFSNNKWMEFKAVTSNHVNNKNTQQFKLKLIASWNNITLATSS